MGADCPTVGLIAQSLEIVQDRGIFGQLERGKAGAEELLASSVALNSLGDRHDRDIARRDAEIGQGFGDGIELAEAAIDQHEIRPGREVAGFTLFQGAGEAPTHDLTHHAVIIARLELGILDIELAILALLKTLRSGDDHAADHVCALDVRVVVDFDALRRGLKIEGARDIVEQARLARRFGEFARQGLAGAAYCLVDEAALFAALGCTDFDLAPGLERQGFGDEVAIGAVRAGEDQARRRALVVELNQEGRENIGLALAFLVAREVDRCAPVLAGADEKDLHG